MTTTRFLGPLAMLASVLLYSLFPSLPGEDNPAALQASLGLFAVGGALTLWQRQRPAMSWLRSLMPQKAGDFSASPPARRVTIRIRCHR